ncbi:MAG TPA: type I-E CRISPR-associated protein Cas6/Cse3/CasE [Acidobacteriaceae bacterium]|nr:type I-E CRISPR-associated protein Cas6/Cse3/CasE [Acidobacteriaceae bacterium]
MSHYFSRVQMRRRSQMPAGERDWLTAHATDGEAELDHALLWTLFTGDRTARDFVFRREQPCGDGRAAVSYLVVSARRPVENGFFAVQSKPYAPRIAAGEYLCFSLRANPVVSRKEDGKAHRHDVLMDVKKQAAEPAERKERMDAAAREWLVRRAPHWGLAVQTETVRMDGYRQMALPGKGRKAGFSTLDYSGLATVTDAELLRCALTAGVGHERSYGCGLLMVKRIR